MGLVSTTWGVLVLVAATVVACASPPTTLPGPAASPQIRVTPTLATPAMVSPPIATPLATPNAGKDQTRVNSTATPPPLDPGMAVAVSAAKQDLAARLSTNINQIQLVSAESVSWPDASLGCPQPGMMYAQVVTEGLRIQLRVGERVYEYHTGRGGAPVLCENRQ